MAKKIMVVISVLSLTMLHCLSTEHNNPLDPDYIGDYSFKITRSTMPEIAYLLKEYLVSYTTGKDTFAAIYPDNVLSMHIDTTRFYDKLNDKIILIALKEDTKPLDFEIIGKTPNNRLFAERDTVLFVNPFKVISLNNPEYKKQYKCRIDLLETLDSLYDSTVVCKWQYGTSLCTLSIDSIYSIPVNDSVNFIIKAVVFDKYGNSTDTLKHLVTPELVRPQVSASDTICNRVGILEIPFKYTDANDKVDSIFYQLQGKPVSSYKAYKDSIDTIRINFDTPETTSIEIWASDETQLRSYRKKITITAFIPDTVKPSLSLLIPVNGYDTIPTNTYLSQVCAKDNFGLTRVYFQTANHVHEGHKVNDTVWSASITDIPLKQNFKVEAVAIDSFANSISVTFYLVYDATISDTIPPDITQKSGPVDGQRVTTNSDTIQCEAKDNSGIDSVYYTIDGIYKDTASLVSTNIYSFNYLLAKFGTNIISVYAVDGSYNKNTATKKITLNYNTIPTGITNISPPDKSTGIDHTNGVILSWSGGDDIDGDAVTYAVKYGTNPSSMQTTSSTTKTVVLNGLSANTQYLWYAEVTTTLDVVRCPAKSDEFYSFTTKDLAAPVITQKSGPKDGEYVLNNVVTMTFDIVDTNGIDSTWYELNNVFQGKAQHISGNEYSITFTMTNYGINQATLYAKDASTVNNISSKTISIIYYSVPTSIIVISPLDNATDIENIGGVTFKWHPSNDADGDLITYGLHYGEETGNMISQLLTDTTISISGLSNNTKYYWYVDVITDHDTVKCPSGNGVYYTFHTKDHPTTISGFNNFSCSINDTIDVNVTASDPETIKEYRWDFNGDGTIEITTSIGSVKYASTNTTGNFKFILSILDDRGGVTKDTAIVTVTNQIPILNAMPDSIYVEYGGNIVLNSDAIDDGTGLQYEWDLGTGSFIIVSNGDTSFAAPQENLPYNNNYIIKVTDEDNNQAFDTIKICVDLTIDKITDENYVYNLIYFKGKFWIYNKDTITTTDDFISFTPNELSDQKVSAPFAVYGNNSRLYAFCSSIPIYSTDGIHWNYVGTPPGNRWPDEFFQINYYTIHLIAPVGINSGHYLSLWGGSKNYSHNNDVFQDNFYHHPTSDTSKFWDTPAELSQLKALKYINPDWTEGNETFLIHGRDGIGSINFVKLVYSDKYDVTEYTTDLNTFNIGDLYIKNNKKWLFNENGISLCIDNGENWNLVKQNVSWGVDTCLVMHVFCHDSKIFIITNIGVWKIENDMFTSKKE